MVDGLNDLDPICIPEPSRQLSPSPSAFAHEI
jgi:hypothetical protein